MSRLRLPPSGVALGSAPWLTSSTCPSPWFTCWSKWKGLQTQVLSASCWLPKQIYSHHSQVLVCQWKHLYFPKLEKYGAPRYLTMPCSPLREPGTQTLTLRSRRLLMPLPFHVQPKSVRVFQDRDTDYSGTKTPTTSGITASERNSCVYTCIYTCIQSLPTSRW